MTLFWFRLCLVRFHKVAVAFDRHHADGFGALSLAMVGVSVVRKYSSTVATGHGFLRPLLIPKEYSGLKSIAKHHTRCIANVRESGLYSSTSISMPRIFRFRLGGVTGVWASHSKLLVRGLRDVKHELLHEWRQVLKTTSADLRIVRCGGQGSWQSQSHECSGTFLHRSLRKLVTAASLACARSQVVPRMIAVIVGEATLAHQSAAGVESFPARQDLSQPSHPVHIVSLVLTLLELVLLVIRATYLAVLFTPAIVLAPFADSFGPKFRKRWISLVHFSLEHGGAAFIKWGQWAAARPDLFPRDLCAQLTKLHSKAPAHKFSQTKQIIEGAFGRRLDEIFEDFEEEPVASGSIAQIHRAVLRFRYPGQMSKPMVVAVKVRHPGVSEEIRRDFTIINWCAKISNFIPGLAWLRLDESIQQFAVFMLTQVSWCRLNSEVCQQLAAFVVQDEVCRLHWWSFSSACS